jgi:malate synthase
VREDKLREANDGFDGTWVAHPDLVSIAREVFDAQLGERPHQKARRRDDVRVDAQALVRIEVPGGQLTDAGARGNVDVALEYLDAWLRGSGAVAIHNLMEDAATAEIARAQLWYWVHSAAALAGGGRMDEALYRSIREDVSAAIIASRGTTENRLADAAELLDRLVLSRTMPEFLTLEGESMLETIDAGAGR